VEKNWSSPVLLASSISGLGLNQIWEQIELYQIQMKKGGFWESNRAGQRLNWLEDQIQFLLGQTFVKHPQVKRLMEKEQENVRCGKLNPGTLAKNLIAVFLSNPSKT
jgi:LAO/AO transport system kinase